MQYYKIQYLFILFVILGSFTFSTAQFVDRYKEYGQDLLKNNDANNRVANWIVNKSSKTELFFLNDSLITLSTPDPSQYLNIHQIISTSLTPGETVKLKGQLSTTNVVAGEKSYNQARLLFVQFSGKNPMWAIDHIVASLSGTNKWKQYDNVFTITPNTTKVKVMLQLVNCIGSFQLKNLVLKKVYPSILYYWVQKFIFFVWGVFLLYLIKLFIFDSPTIFFKALIIFLAACIIFATSLPGEIKTSLKMHIADKIESITNKNISLIGQKDTAQTQSVLDFGIQNIGHLFLFGIFGFFLALCNKEYHIHIIFMFLVLFAGATEFIQFFIQQRHPTFSDFLLDCSGALFGCWLCRILYKK
jgi:VanZ family protein